MREDLKGLPLDEAKPIFAKLYNDKYTHDLEVEELESAFNRADKTTLGDIHCFKGHFLTVEDLVAMSDDEDPIALPLTKPQIQQAIKLKLVKRWSPNSEEEWASLLEGSYKANELKSMMLDKGLVPKGRKADLAKGLAAYAVTNPDQMPPSDEFFPGERLLPALKEAMSNMVCGLGEAIISHPYHYQCTVWEELLLTWPSSDWPWLAEIVKAKGGKHV